MTQMTELLEAIGKSATGVELRALDTGGVAQAFRVRETETHFIDVIETLFNWRVVASWKPDDGVVYDAVYCYLGKGVDSYVRAVLGAMAWDGPGHIDPPGWDKNAGTGQWRVPREEPAL